MTSISAVLCAAVLSSTAYAQTVTSIPAMTAPVFSTIDMDNAGPGPGPVTLGAINQAGLPAAAIISAITLTPSASAAGLYGTNPQGLGLGLGPSGGLELISDAGGPFTSFDARIDFLTPITEFGLNVGDWIGPMILDFYLAGTLQTSFTTPGFVVGSSAELMQMSGGTFDRVDIRASTAAGNWVITELVVEFSAAGLFPAFIQDVTSGPAPLTVNFTDYSFSSDPSGIITWLWDFDNDGTPDSTVQNPTHTYASCGNYSVTLQVLDATHGFQSFTKTNLIAIDPVTASFTYSVAGNNTVQFTDTSTGAVTGWMWDFDNDGVIDSTVQSPIFTYPSAGTYDVTLTADNGCTFDSVTQSVPTVPVLCTINPFLSNNQGNAGGGVYFNLTTTSSIAITQLDLNLNSAAGTTGTIELYTTPGTHVGNEGNASVWTLGGSAAVTAAGTNQVSTAAFGTPIAIPAGTTGIALCAVGLAHAYTNGTGANQQFSDSVVTIDLGSANNVCFGGSPFTPRVWNGCIYYDTSPQGFYGTFGAGCPNSAGNVTALTAPSPPKINQTFSVNLNNLPIDVAIMVFGVSNTTFNGAPLPLDMAQFGMPGCDGLVAPETTVLVLGSGGSGTWNLPIPNNPAFVGAVFYNQALVLDPGVNQLGAVMSDGAGGVVGQ